MHQQGRISAETAELSIELPGHGVADSVEYVTGLEQRLAPGVGTAHLQQRVSEAAKRRGFSSSVAHRPAEPQCFLITPDGILVSTEIVMELAH